MYEDYWSDKAEHTVRTKHKQRFAWYGRNTLRDSLMGSSHEPRVRAERAVGVCHVTSLC